MSGLAWLNELMQWLGRWVPRLVLVKATHVGVRFTRGGVVTAMAPGLYCYWPITTEVTLVSTRRRTQECAAQLCGREAVSITIEYEISNPLAALQAYNDVFAQLDDRAQAALLRAYSADRDNATIANEVFEQLVALFEPHGLKIWSVSVIQRGTVISLKNLNDWAQHAKAVLE